MVTITRKLRASGLLAGVALVLTCSTAAASTATISSTNRISVTGEGSERNAVSISYDAIADAFIVRDTAGVDGSNGCTDVDAATVTCPGAGVPAVTVKTGSGSDLIMLDRATMPATIEGSLDGGSGNDHVSGASADDSLIGGTNHDLLDGGPGADELRGSGGTDIGHYGDRGAGVSVTIGAGDENDGNADDQSGAARDTVRGDVEHVTGGLGGDTIVGDGSAEVLFGGAGDDLLFGGRGNDTLLGSLGNDRLNGDNGRDILRGQENDDSLHGGDGDDRAVGGPQNDFVKGNSGVDVMKGKSGIDRIFARDGGRDARINCGPGPNRLERAKRDRGKRDRSQNDPRARSC